MSRCSQCGGQITWKREDGRWQCFDEDGKTHWDTCSKRRWAQTVATGTRFEGQRFEDKTVRSGYAKSVHGTKFDRISAKPIRGANYRPSGHCKQCVPAWEDCVGCPDEIAA